MAEHHGINQILPALAGKTYIASIYKKNHYFPHIKIIRIPAPAIPFGAGATKPKKA